MYTPTVPCRAVPRATDVCVSLRMAEVLASRRLGFKYDMVAPSDAPYVATRACNSASRLLFNECVNRDTVRRLATHAIWLRGRAFWRNRMRKYTYICSVRHFGKYQHRHIRTSFSNFPILLLDLLVGVNRHISQRGVKLI
jgi:hypothetical protein